MAWLAFGTRPVLLPPNFRRRCHTTRDGRGLDICGKVESVGHEASHGGQHSRQLQCTGGKHLGVGHGDVARIAR